MNFLIKNRKMACFLKKNQKSFIDVEKHLSPTMILPYVIKYMEKISAKRNERKKKE